MYKYWHAADTDSVSMYGMCHSAPCQLLWERYLTMEQTPCCAAVSVICFRALPLNLQPEYLYILQDLMSWP